MGGRGGLGGIGMNPLVAGFGNPPLPLTREEVRAERGPLLAVILVGKSFTEYLTGLGWVYRDYKKQKPHRVQTQ